MTTPTPDEQRDQLLHTAHRWAGLATISHTTALKAARALMNHDQLHGTHTPDQPGPGSNTWTGDTGPLDYVHAQWQHRTT